MKLTNTTKGDLGLDPETIVPAMGALEIDNEELTAHKKNPIVKHWLVSGDLVESGAEKTAENSSGKKGGKG
ncbi:hypothetical protein [Oceaniglobus ichthyenteri]|uniref:hypothetical protein n=1 Tax=Oceaniglobus ichthyenteri TaxID=2136177 RepID=UPI000D3D7C8C|nr:hypothetical protein [Oceaniglobus ichthyenteri]